MSRRYPGGLITKTPVVPTTSAAPGIWTLDQAITYIQAGTWPIAIGGPYWIGTLGTGSLEIGNSVAVDRVGNVYVFGRTDASGDVRFQIAKYNTSGTIQWQQNLGVSGLSAIGTSVAVDSSGNVYVCGQSDASGVTDFQIAKYNTSGTIQWERRLGSSVSVPNVAYSIAVDSSGNVYVCGYSNEFNGDFQIAKYNTSGTIQWQRKLGGTVSGDIGRSIAVDSSGNVYVCGQSDASGVNDFQIAKYDTSGTIQWQRRLGGTGSAIGYSIAIDSSGNVYVCGYSNASGNNKFQIAKYDTSGTIQWQRSLGFSSSTEYGNSVAVDYANNVYVCGYSNRTGTGALQMAKYNSSGTIQWQRYLRSGFEDVGYSVAVDYSGNVYVCGASNASGSYNFLFAKLPTDGSLTGSYTVGGRLFTYAASALTDDVSTLTSATSTLTDSASSLTSAISTQTAATTTLTSSVTVIS